MIQLAAEVGGTFTDLIWTDGKGRLHTHKVPSTPFDPSLAVIQGTDECLGDALPQLRRLFHGSTVATNAVLERKGGRTALVTTRGFKDILVLQRQTRPNVNSIVCRKPEPLVPLRRTVEATERVSVEGEVMVPLEERWRQGADARPAFNRFLFMMPPPGFAFSNPAGARERLATLAKRVSRNCRAAG